MPLVNLRILVTVFAASLLIFGETAWAGRLHPELERQLDVLPPGERSRWSSRW